MAKIKRLIVGAVNQNPRIRRMVKWTVRCFWRLRYRLIRAVNHTEEKLYVFEAYQGRQYACSPRAIYEELLTKEVQEGARFIWVFREPERYEFLKKNPGTTLVKLGTHQYYRAFARAQYWIVNSRTRHALVPGADQCFLQTWHGTPLKRLGCDIAVEGNNRVSAEEMKQDYRREGERVTYFLSPSSFYSRKITSAFDLSPDKAHDAILELGYPRNDALFDADAARIAAIRSRLKLPEGKRTILYAPTFRDNRHTRDGCAFTMGFSLERFCERFSEEYVLLFRTHYFITEQVELAPFAGTVFDVTDWDDINELYLISDVLVTDYSSVFFDYANLKRPILFFMYDLEEYQEQIRDFYLDIRELPGPILRNEEELYNALEAPAGECYDARYQAFHEKYNYLDGAGTSRRVIERLHRLGKDQRMES